MSFSEAVATLPDAIRLWVLWLTIVMVIAPVALLVDRTARREGLVVLIATIAVMVSMQALHAAVGFVRLLGLPHVLVWTPLAVWLVHRLRVAPLSRRAQATIGVFLVSIAVSLVFDYVDVARYVAGDRASMAGG